MHFSTFHTASATSGPSEAIVKIGAAGIASHDGKASDMSFLKSIPATRFAITFLLSGIGASTRFSAGEAALKRSVPATVASEALRESPH